MLGLVGALEWREQQEELADKTKQGDLGTIAKMDEGGIGGAQTLFCADAASLFAD